MNVFNCKNISYAYTKTEFALPMSFIEHFSPKPYAQHCKFIAKQMNVAKFVQ